MLIDMQTPDVNDYLIYDFAGNVLGFVTSFDTETCEIELGIHLNEGKLLTQRGDGGEPAHVLVKFVLQGAYAEYKGTRV